MSVRYRVKKRSHVHHRHPRKLQGYALYLAETRARWRREKRRDVK